MAEAEAHFVLVHGLSHGAWCWHKIRCLLEANGYKVTCLDLTSSGIDLTDPDTVFTLQHYNQPLLHFFTHTLPHDQKVILVGHSAGGISVTDAMYRFPHQIQAVVFVAAPMLKRGFSTPQDYKDGTPDLSEYGDDVSECGYGLGPLHPPTSVMLKKQFQRQILFNLSPLEDSTLASMLIRRGPTTPFREAQFSGGDEQVDAVPRVYIKTVLDRALKLDQQERMITRWPPSQVFAIHTDHSPFFSAPLLLCGFLVKVASTSF